MDGNKLKGFFYPGNAVRGEPDYRFAKFFVRSAKAFANTAVSDPTLRAPYIGFRLVE